MKDYYPQIRRALAGRLWYVEPRKMEEILTMFEMRLSGGAAAPDVLAPIRATNAAAAARAQKASARSGSTAVLPVYGMLMNRQMFDMSGGSAGTSCISLSAALRQLVKDPNVGQIVLDIDSPGGDVEGVDELASEIYQARKSKRIVGVSNCLCASAAYYIAAQCSEVVVSPSSLTGSIGVYMLHEDDSGALDAAGIRLEMIRFGEHKGEGNNLGPLTDSAREHMQAIVDGFGNQFEKAVARGRGVTQDVVHKSFGQGRVFDAKTAVRIGMADRVGTLTDVLTATPALSSSASGRRAQFAAVSTPRGRSELARMRHELLMAGGGTVAKPQRKRADGGDDSDCSCDCVPCDGGDCDNCSHDGCDCEGCDCEMATAAAKEKARAAEFSRMRHEIAVAARV